MSVDNLRLVNNNSAQSITEAKVYGQVTSDHIAHASDQMKKSARLLVDGLATAAGNDLGRFVVSAYNEHDASLPLVVQEDAAETLSAQYYPYFVHGVYDGEVHDRAELAVQWFAGLAYLSTTAQYRNKVSYALIEAVIHDLKVSPPMATTYAWRLVDGVYAPTTQGHRKFTVRAGWNVDGANIQ